MSLSTEYERQRQWRDWTNVLDALPLLVGRTVLDLGCGVGDQAAELVARGARVIGVDMNDELLRTARSKHLANAVRGRRRHGVLEISTVTGSRDVHPLIAAFIEKHPEFQDLVVS